MPILKSILTGGTASLSVARLPAFADDSYLAYRCQVLGDRSACEVLPRASGGEPPSRPTDVMATARPGIATSRSVRSIRSQVDVARFSLDALSCGRALPGSMMESAMLTPTPMPHPRAERHPAVAACDPTAHYELRFAGMFNAGRGYAFPCDANGFVDIDTLAEAARTNYFYARALVGREFFAPVTRVVESAVNG
jgi:hypothetical protein